MKDNVKNIIQKKINEVVPYKRNPRKNDNAVDYVANSIREFGFQSPIIIDENDVIICGHTRYKAAKKLGLKTVPCIVAKGLTDEQVKAYRIADNKVSEMSEWDDALLKGELSELSDIDMSEFGIEFSFFNNAQILIEKAIDFQYVIEEMQEAFPQNNARYIGAKLVKK